VSRPSSADGLIATIEMAEGKRTREDRIPTGPSPSEQAGWFSYKYFRGVSNPSDPKLSATRTPTVFGPAPSRRPSEKLGVFCKRLRTIAYSPCRSDHPLSPFPGIRNGSIRRPFAQIHPLRLVPPRLTRSATIHVTSRQRCLMGNGYNGETTEIM
jgi:hypothetical protein